MPVTNLAVSSAGTITGWSNGAGTLPTSLHSNDGNTSYRQATTAGPQDSLLMASLPTSVSISNVKSRFWARESGNGSLDFRQWTAGAAAVDGGPGGFVALTSSYAEYTDDWTNDANGTPLTPASFTTAEWGYKAQTVTTNVRVTMFDLDVTHTIPEGGGFVFLIGSWAGALISAGASLLNSEISLMTAHLKSRPAFDFEFGMARDYLRKRRTVYGFAG